MSKIRRLKCATKIFPQLELIKSTDLRPFLYGKREIDFEYGGEVPLNSSFSNKGQLALTKGWNWEIIVDEEDNLLLICVKPPIKEED